ncbi:hypothetical protein R1flu_013272 [Riccia fluitans]|uniref:Uncharacterized protein n=1 Tax=Riccia fluitans TaxID=41844 RepID=A0ABD1YCT5_9MARC
MGDKEKMFRSKSSSMDCTQEEEELIATVGAVHDDEMKRKKMKKKKRHFSAMISIRIPRGCGVKDFCSMSPSTKVTLSPKDMKEQNKVAVAAAADAAGKRWKVTVKAFSRIVLKVPVNCLRKARDCYVRSLADLAGNFGSSTACGVYGAGHFSMDQLPAAWRTESQRYRSQRIQEERDFFSESFKQSLRETRVTQSFRTSGPMRPQVTRSGSLSSRVSSARVYGISSMPIYTITETS